MDQPQAPDVEIAVLGSCLSDHQAALSACGLLKNDDTFFASRHRQIFAAIREIVDKGQVPDTITVGQSLKDQKAFAQIGEHYLAELTTYASQTERISNLCAILIEKKVRRDLIAGSKTMEIMARDEKTYPETLDLLDWVQTLQLDIAGQLPRSRRSKMSSALSSLISNVTDLAITGGDMLGDETGFVDVDHLTSFTPGNLVIVAGRPSQGKTSLAFDIARNMAKRDIPTGFFSLEMSIQELALKALSQESGVSTHRIRRTATLTGDELKRLNIGITAASGIWGRITLDESGDLSLPLLRTHVNELIAREHVRGIFVDYLQLMTPPSGKESRNVEVGELTRGLKQLAQKHKIWVCCLSQLNRMVESRKNKRPVLSDLRESGNIEQDADVCLFVHRPETYGEDQFDDGESTRGMAELIIAKNRMGPTGIARVCFDAEYTRFRNYFKTQGGPHE